MFPTRARILTVLLLIGITAMFARAVQVQLWQHKFWLDKANSSAAVEGSTQTTRGRILDYKGRELAINAPCVDAVVDYRVISSPPDEKWVREYATDRLRAQLGGMWSNVGRQQRSRLLDEQIEQVKADIDKMWLTLGDPALTGCTREQVDDRRQQVLQRVQMRRRYIWYQNYLLAERRHESDRPAWWKRLLSEDEDVSIQVDTFDVVVDEQRKSHVILPAISPDLVNYITKNLDRFPGLSLRPGQHRVYPYKESACHLLGYLTQVTRDDLLKDPDKANALRKYELNDEIGRQGIEAMCESALRGVRGRIRRDRASDEILEQVDPEAGTDVHLTIDIELQKEIEAAFVRRLTGPSRTQPDESLLHGAAVVIDVPTGQVRALASNPTYDVNELDKNYARLVKDEINKPLINRATMMAVEPGSTVKPILGLAGITEGVVGIHEGIECTGRLILDGKTYSVGKCWTETHHTPGHHQSGNPHVGRYGNANGFLTYADALERSCNVWCETVADRLGWQRISRYYSLFGLGQKTGLGIAERAGRLPMLGGVPRNERMALTWFSGIGQGHVAATPIQMANVAATIARKGVWMRPNLVAEGWSPATQPSTPDRVVLPISKAGLAEAWEGMYNVVNAPKATGTQLKRQEIAVAGKTGTAQAAKFGIPIRDENGKVARWEYPEISTADHPNEAMRWYRGSGTSGTDLAHAWFIGFAPADHPQIAFAVMVEYGGGGGAVAGPVAQAMFDALEKQGYLSPQVASR